MDSSPGDRNTAGGTTDLAAHTNRMLKDNNLDLNRLQADLARADWAQALNAAREALQHRRAALGEPETESAPASIERPSEQKEAESVTSEGMPATPAPAPPAKGLLHSLETTAAADRTCKKHEAVRHALKAALLWADLQPADSPVIDVSRTAEDGHFLPAPADRLYLVLSEPPAEDWSADTVFGVFGVQVLWRTPDSWGGHDAETALGSGVA